MSEQITKNTIANPAPLGLLGFGMTTCLLNIHNAGFIPLSIVIVAMGFALGGAAARRKKRIVNVPKTI